MLKRAVILAHRYLGIPLSLVFVVWFVSGIVMMYTGGMPETSAAERIEQAEPLDLGLARLSAAEAFAAAGAVGEPRRARLKMLQGRPIYRFDGFRGSTLVFADTAEILDALTPPDAVGVAADFAHVAEQQVRFVATVDEPDQWTLLLRGELPLYRLEIDDDAGTEIYVAPGTGEVSLATTRLTRALAWAGAIPHWFYFTRLRVNQPLWYWLVVWVAAIGCLLAVLGLLLGVLQFKPSKPFRVATSIRYRGWMRWHYVLGILFGLFALTWVFSGMLSMEPFTRTSSAGLDLPRGALSGGPLELDRFRAPPASGFGGLGDPASLKEIELLRIQDGAYYRPRYAQGSRATATGSAHPALVAAETMTPRAAPFATESILERVRSALPDVPIESSELLGDYDAYYYARGAEAPLPVLRIQFADPDASWYYIDPWMSQVVYRAHRGGRWQRWLFNGLHSLDFAFWYDRRPLWDVGMIVLSLGALSTSLIGACLGIKRLRQGLSG